MTEIDRRSKRFWERLAARDPHYFTFPEASLEDYYTSGQATVDSLLTRFAPNGGRKRALDIGCGLGRLTFALTDHFAQVTGIDICDRLLDSVRARQLTEHTTNLIARRVDEPWESDGPFDFVVSLYVMQHVSTWQQIDSYLDSIESTLAPEGVAILHFETRPQTLGYRMRSHLPGLIAPRQLKPGYRRHRREPELLEARFKQAGLRVEHSQEVGTSFALYVLTPSAAAKPLRIAV